MEPGGLQSTGPPRVSHGLATERQQRRAAGGPASHPELPGERARTRSEQGASLVRTRTDSRGTNSGNFSNSRAKVKWAFVFRKQVYLLPIPMFSTPPWLPHSVILESPLSTQPLPPLSIILACFNTVFTPHIASEARAYTGLFTWDLGRGSRRGRGRVLLDVALS